jgi:hypothetical protein
MIREPIAEAVFARLQTVANFVTSSRRLRSWTDVSPAEQPALFLAQATQRATQKPGLGPVWDWKFDAHIYVNTGQDTDVAPGTLMNPILDALEAAFAPDNVVTNKLTLGGLVQHCWIEGEIATDEGVLGGQGVSIIPIFVKVA